MEIMSTKQKILNEALKLFSVYGYEATSIGQIADAVGIRKASLYSHFKSKQEILDVLIEEIKLRYKDYSFFAASNWDNDDFFSVFLNYTEDDIVEIVKKQFSYIIHDQFLNRVRKFMTIEQFRNPEIAMMQDKHIYSDVLDFHRKLISFLVEKEIFEDKGIEIMAHEFFSTISVQLFRIQREPESEDDAIRIVENHIKHMCKIYRRN